MAIPVGGDHIGSMAIYSVHQPPAFRNAKPRRADPTGPDCFVFVRDGFHFWAFLVPLLWFLRYRLWLVLLGYLALSAALVFGLAVSGVSRTSATLALLAVAILLGLEAGSLRRWTLRRNGWRELGVIAAHGRDEAERLFFDRWAQEARSRATSAAEPKPTSGRMPRFAPPPDVIGLFPAPERRP